MSSLNIVLQRSNSVHTRGWITKRVACISAHLIIVSMIYILPIIGLEVGVDIVRKERGRQRICRLQPFETGVGRRQSQELPREALPDHSGAKKLWTVLKQVMSDLVVTGTPIL